MCVRIILGCSPVSSGETTTPTHPHNIEECLHQAHPKISSYATLQHIKQLSWKLFFGSPVPQDISLPHFSPQVHTGGPRIDHLPGAGRVPWRPSPAVTGPWRLGLRRCSPFQRTMCDLDFRNMIWNYLKCFMNTNSSLKIVTKLLPSQPKCVVGN